MLRLLKDSTGWPLLTTPPAPGTVFLACAFPLAPLVHPDLWQSSTNASRMDLGCLQGYAKPAIYQLGIQPLAHEKCRDTGRSQGLFRQALIWYNGKKQM